MDEVKKKEVSIELGIVRIANLGFQVDEQLEIPEKTNLRYTLTNSFNSQEDWFEFILTSTYIIPGTEMPFLSSTSLTRFFIKGLKRFEIKKAETVSIDLPDQILVTLFSISFSHARAIQMQNTTGTKFQNIYLPIINPEETLKNIYSEIN